MRITINAGHYPGLDNGAIGPAGTREGDITRVIGKQVCDYLAAVGHEVNFVQENELSWIVDDANEFQSDCFISLHCNSAASAQAHGVEIYTSPGITRADKLADYIMAQYSSTFPELVVRSDYSDGDIDKEADFYVLINTAAPAVLLELAFISNPFEEGLLTNKQWQQKAAAAIARGITDYNEYIKLK